MQADFGGRLIKNSSDEIFSPLLSYAFPPKSRILRNKS